MFEHVFIEGIKDRLQGTLPGSDAHFLLSHPARKYYPPPPADARLAGVLALFFPRQGAWHILLIERENNNPNDRHGGQISFPGGKFEPEDASLEHTALREAWEETGVPADKVQVIGKLTELYIPVSNFLVHPYVGFLAAPVVWQPQPEEVKSILEVPFEHFLAPGAVKKTDFRLPNQMVLKDMPYFDVAGKVVWGATAMMLSELLEVARGTIQTLEEGSF